MTSRDLPVPGTVPGSAQLQSSGPTQNAVEVGAADRALGLGHLGAFVVHDDVSLGLALLLALDAVELAFVGFVSHCFLLSPGPGCRPLTPILAASRSPRSQSATRVTSRFPRAMPTTRVSGLPETRVNTGAEQEKVSGSDRGVFCCMGSLAGGVFSGMGLLPGGASRKASGLGSWCPRPGGVGHRRQKGSVSGARKKLPELDRHAFPCTDPISGSLTKKLVPISRPRQADL